MGGVIERANKRKKGQWSISDLVTDGLPRTQSRRGLLKKEEKGKEGREGRQREKDNGSADNRHYGHARLFN